MKTLIAITTCHRDEYQEKANAQRATWVKDVRGADVRFFAGGWGHRKKVDDVWLDCPDSYEERKQKVRMMIYWALEAGYQYLWKTDDDIYLRPERLLAIPNHDYCGAVLNLERSFSESSSYFAIFDQLRASIPVQACHGWLYGLSKKAMETLLLPDRWANEWHEDIWVARQLRSHGIIPTQLGGVGGLIRCTHKKGVANGWVNQEPPHPNNEVIASCEYTGPQMMGVHRAFRSVPSETGS